VSQGVRVGAVILAAGASSRMGRPKQLLQVGDTSLLRRAALSALKAKCAPVVVVTGANAELMRLELEVLKVEESVNDDWESGMASSIRTGIEALCSCAPDLDAAVLMLCDQPYATAGVIAGLIDAFEATHKPVVASTYGDSFGVPAFFDRTLFAELIGLEGQAGAKEIIKRHALEAHFHAFPGGAMDVDTPEDFARLLANEGSQVDER